MPKNNNHLFPPLTDEKKAEIYNGCVAAMDAETTREDEAYASDNYISTLMLYHINPLDGILIGGPFTGTDFLDRIGVPKTLYEDPMRRIKLIRYLQESQGIVTFNAKKNGRNRDIIEHSDEIKQDIAEAEANDGKFKLTRWDKFWAYFGVKTDHALKVETARATLEVYKEKQQALAKTIMSTQMNLKSEDFLYKYKTAQQHNREALNAVKENLDGWRKLFFGDEADGQVKDYVLDNGKKVSSLSLCMALLQQTVKNDLSTVSPEKAGNNLKIKEIAEKIGAEIKDKASKSRLKQFKFLTGFNGDAELSNLDRDLKGMLKRSGKEPHVIGIGEARKYNGIPDMKNAYQRKAKNEILGKAYIMYKVKQDMAAIFGENDPVYGMNANKTLDDLAAANLEKHIKEIYKSAKLYAAIESENYDVLLKTAGISDYNNLEDAFDKADKMLNLVEVTREAGVLDTDSIDLRAEHNLETEEILDEVTM